jgi:DNA-binding MarR family transcriptional regulator
MVLERNESSTANPDADVGAAMRRLQTAVDAFDELVARKLQINRTDLRCLDIILQEGRITAGALSKASHLTTGGATTVIDRLERAGWVHRVRDPRDRRLVFVEATSSARRITRKLYQPIQEAGQHLLSRFSPQERAAIHEFLEGSRELNEEVARRLGHS